MAIDNIQDFNNEIEELRRTMRLFGQDTGDSSAKLKQFGRATADSVGDLSRATRSFVDNVARGSTNMSSMSGVVGSATNALGKLLNVVPGIGRGLKFLSDSVGEAAQAVLQLTDEVGQTFNEFSRVGALTADNIEGLRQQFLASGQSLQNFRKTIIENSVSFAQFGGTVSQGTNTFVNSVGKLADPSSKLGDSLRRLGLNTEDIVESGAAYLRQQILLGRNEFVTQQSLTSGTQNLALEMDRLAKITGANRKQLQEQREAELREGIFGASIRELERAGRKKEAQAIQNTSNILSNLVSPETAQGFRDLMSGFASSPDALRLMMSTANEAQRVVDDLKSGRIDDLQAVQRMSRAAKGLEVTVDRFATVGGDASGVYMAATNQTRMANLTLKDRTDLEQQLTATREKQLSEQNKTTENFIKANKELEVLNRQINAFAFAAVNPATIAVQKFTGAVNEVVRLIGEKLGIQGFAGGGAGAGGGTGPGPGAGAGGGAGPGAGAGGGAGAGAGAGAGGGAGAGAGAGAGGGAGARASATDILKLVAGVESNNNANAMFPNTTVSGLTDKTVQEVLALQNQRVTELGLASSAAGKYQIIQETLADLVNKGVINLNDKFDDGTQERAARALLERRGFGQYQRGEISAEDFANNLAYEFAALPGPNGQSVYNRDGINRARVSREQVMSVLGARNGGILSGPTSGYRATLHGTEAVIPLSGGRSIPVEMPGFTDGIRQLAEVMNNQNSKLDDLIDMMRASNNISKDMLRYQRA